MALATHMDFKEQIMHYSRMTQSEKLLAREHRENTAGIPNRHGGISYFHQGGNGKQPTDDEVAASVQWNRGTETAGHQTFTYGPRFDKLLADTPVNAESESAGLHTLGRKRG